MAAVIIPISLCYRKQSQAISERDRIAVCVKAERGREADTKHRVSLSSSEN